MRFAWCEVGPSPSIDPQRATTASTGGKRLEEIMKSAWVLVAVLAASVAFPSMALAADGDDERSPKPASDSARIQQLSDELQALRALVDTQSTELQSLRGSVNGKAALNLDGTTLPKELQAAQAQEPAKPALPEVVKSKWAMNIYGFVEADFIYDNRQSGNLTDGAFNAALPRKESYQYEHGQLTFGARNSRIGFNVSAPEYAGIRASAKLEMDFEGINGGATANNVGGAGATQVGSGAAEANATWVNPTFRFRHMYLTLDSDYVTAQIGQGWQLFGWQPYFHPNTVDIQGMPGQVYSRSPKIQLSHKFRGPVDIEIGAAASRPPERDSASPDLQAGIKLTLPDWVGVHTIGSTGTAVDAAGLGISGLTRSFRVQQGSPPAGLNSDAARADAAALDLFLPVLHPNKDNRGNSLSLTAEATYGKGFNDEFSAFNYGIGAASITQLSDQGAVGFRNGDLTAIQLQTFIAGIQYYFPGDGMQWIALNYSSIHSRNINQMTNTAGTAFPVTTVFKSTQWLNASLFWDVTPAVRFGLAVDQYRDTWLDSAQSKDLRIQFSAFYLF